MENNNFEESPEQSLNKDVGQLNNNMDTIINTEISNVNN